MRYTVRFTVEEKKNKLNISGDPVELLENGKRQRLFLLPSMPSRIPLYKNQTLGITRGGITVLDHFVARCPIAIAEEPGHWLSHQQREAAIGKKKVAIGDDEPRLLKLGLPISLYQFRDNPNEVIADLLTNRQNELSKVTAHMREIQTDAEKWFAEYLIQRFLT